MYPYQGSALTHFEWRIYDPAQGGDALFLANAGGFDELRWDTTFRTAWYRSGLTLYAVDWKRGAKPRAISTLPDLKSPVDWWFNPDSACWQYGAAVLIDSSAARLRYACELWQSSRDFKRWHRIRSDTLECESGECDEWSWTEGEWARHAPSVTLEDLDAPSWVASWEAHALPFDTATVRVVVPEPGDERDWHYVATGRSLRRGVAFRMTLSENWVGAEPVYFVDLDRKTKRRIETGRREDSWTESFLAERCGLLLMPGAAGAPLLVNSETGRVVFAQPWNSRDAVWVTRPR